MRISKLRNMSKSLFWGDRPLPEDSELKGVIESDNGRTGVLLKLKDGMYVLGTAGTLLQLNQDKIRRQTKRSLIAAEDKKTLFVWKGVFYLVFRKITDIKNSTWM